jgi:hypothetical protein
MKRVLQSALMRFRVIGVVVLSAAALLYGETYGSGAVEITAEPHHHLVLENQYVRVFKVEVPPHGETLMHRHRHDYMFVTLGDSDIENDVAGKSPVKLKLEDGETHFAAGNFEHVAKDLAGTAFRNVTVEFLKDAQAQKRPAPKWDQERGLNILRGGTQDILFAKDGARVSEIELQPGGMMPRHEKGPLLLVAISDLELRGEAKDDRANALQVKAGDIKWMPSGYGHAMTNVGKEKARLVLVEFQ